MIRLHSVFCNSFFIFLQEFKVCCHCGRKNIYFVSFSQIIWNKNKVNQSLRWNYFLNLFSIIVYVGYYLVNYLWRKFFLNILATYWIIVSVIFWVILIFLATFCFCFEWLAKLLGPHKFELTHQTFNIKLWACFQEQYSLSRRVEYSKNKLFVCLLACLCVHISLIGSKVMWTQKDYVPQKLDWR